MLLKKGSRGDNVKKLQSRLALPVDGKFGSDTELQVKAWQTRNGLVADGIVEQCHMGKIVSNIVNSG